MNRKLQAVTIVTATAAMLAVPTAAFAGTRGHSTCNESFLRWHTEIEPIEGGYVTIDFGRDGVDYTTTKWGTTSVVGLGELFPGKTVRVQWHAADGTVVGEKGNGVVIEVDHCSPSETTVPTTEAPATTQAAVTTEAPAVTEAPVVTDPAPVSTPAPSPNTQPAPIVTDAPVVQEIVAPPAPALVPAAVPTTVLVEAARPTAPAALPITGARDKAPYLLVGVSLLGAGMLLAASARRRRFS